MSVPTPAVPVRVDVLGPLALYVDGAVVDVPGKRRRAVLATLALARGRVVSAERLVDTLWSDSPPEDAVQALYNHASRLRRHLGPAAGRLRRVGGGYVLDLAGDELDAARARRLAGRVDLSSPDDASMRVREALALWRGPALQEFRDMPPMQAESVGLDELRLRLRDDLTEALVQLGDTGAAAEAAAAATAQPLRERSALLLMRALAREGRTSEAMAAGAAYRRALTEETGLDPGPSLAALEQDIAKGGIATGPVPAMAFGPRPLARPSGPFIGRQQDREEIIRLLRDHRAVTVSGPGGVGKTRLALDVVADPEALHDGSEGVVLRRPGRRRPARFGCALAVASTLGLRTRGDVAAGDVAAALAGRSLLLLELDNCEHVVGGLPRAGGDAAPWAPRGSTSSPRRASRSTCPASTSSGCSRCRCHATADRPGRRCAASRSSARSSSTPARGAPTSSCARGRMCPTCWRVVRRLDGLPLGIELAARQVCGDAGLRAVRERLDRALDLATRSPRTGATRASRPFGRTIAGVVPGSSTTRGAPCCGRWPRSRAGSTWRGVEALAADAGPGGPSAALQGLVDASLVVVDAETDAVPAALTVRAFLLDELARHGELEAARSASWTVPGRPRPQLGAELFGTPEAAADRRLRAELDNLRAARDLAGDTPRRTAWIDITLALDRGDDLARPAGGLGLVPGAGRRPRDRRTPPRGRRARGGASDAARLTGDFELCVALAERALATETSSDRGAQPVAPGGTSSLAAVAHFRGDFARAALLWGTVG